jgi:hypothetical protein
MLDPTKYAEVRRILQRYIVEVVERFDLCPWAASARLNDEVSIEVVGGEPTVEQWVAAIDRAFAKPTARVAMIVAPDLVIEPRAFHDVRERVVTQRKAYGIAEFHPNVALDLTTPARLVPFLRRSPDPLLQCVPLSLLGNVRSTKQVADLFDQAQILRGIIPPVKDVGADIEATNHATVSAQHAEIVAVLDDIARDRASAYR